MRNILLVSCFNELTNTIYNMLTKDNDNIVQLCQSSSDMLQKTIDITKPELIVVSLNGLDASCHPLFISLRNAFKHIPVLCCGNSNEQTIFQHHFNSDQFHVTEAYDNADILCETVNNILTNASSETEFSSISESDTDVPDNDTAVLDNDTTFSDKDTDIPKNNTDVSDSDSDVPSSPARNSEDKKAILLVDDDPLLLRTVRSLLHDKYKILMATSGAEALVVLGRQSPDLIILDYNMPVCDGRQTLKMIRNLESAKDIPVVFLTSIGDKPHIEMALKLNPAGYLLKPVNKEMLFEIIDQIL